MTSYLCSLEITVTYVLRLFYASEYSKIRRIFNVKKTWTKEDKHSMVGLNLDYVYERERNDWSYKL